MNFQTNNVFPRTLLTHVSPPWYERAKSPKSDIRGVSRNLWNLEADRGATLRLTLRRRSPQKDHIRRSTRPTQILGEAISVAFKAAGSLHLWFVSFSLDTAAVSIEFRS